MLIIANTLFDKYVYLFTQSHTLYALLYFFSHFCYAVNTIVYSYILSLINKIFGIFSIFSLNDYFLIYLKSYFLFNEQKFL